SDPGEMKHVMGDLRRLTAAGATVVVLHHRAKDRTSDFRGTTEILAGCDLMLKLVEDSDGLLQLQSIKNRFGARFLLTLKPDFANCRFEITESAKARSLQGDTERLEQLISTTPGLTTREIVQKAGMRRLTVTKLLKEHTGELWKTSEGRRGATTYY